MKDKLLYLTIGLLIVTTPVNGQAPGPVAGWKTHFWGYPQQLYWALLENGDVYMRDGLPNEGGTLTYAGNVWEGISAPSSPIMYWEILPIATDAYVFVILENGDMYRRTADLTNGGILNPDIGQQYMGNFWTDLPVPTSPETWGKIKSTYEKK